MLDIRRYLAVSSDKPRAQAIKTIADQIAQQVREIIENSTKTCVNCMNFDPPTEHCLKATPRQRPPANVIVKGCPAWEDDGTIPF